MAYSALKRPHSPSPSPNRSPSPTGKRLRTSCGPKSVRFLVLSDTHGSELPSYPECDVVLHCGDLTEDGSAASISSALQALGKSKAELKLAIAGNHEISLDKEYYLSEGGLEADYLKSRSLVSGPDPEAEKNGVTFLEEGTHEFILKSGATFRIFTSQWTPKYGSSAFQYDSGEDRFNPTELTPKWAKNVGTETSIVPEGIDIVMTHGPPKYILDDTSDGRSAGCEHLRRAIARTKPRIHCFGHVHGGYGIQRIEFNSSAKLVSKDEESDAIVTLPKDFIGKNQAKRKGYASLPPGAAEAFRTKKQTLIINAAIMDDSQEPGNAPWIVDLELPSC
ncbi:Metallo-dependent phosphatase [Melanomma pulvis-pyrius CBS 109.77]|uniref:Metallo-dependent phosphatase n=1 Tax=Melanomma pulvis-pyrius CBS 109.77 TaxID=1314802 RepID=A0A6A6XKU8_9PLEO|nr:Metallo-dependent phosphatase [Melanomma pulvis-pyrius CBS 109.77]